MKNYITYILFGSLTLSSCVNAMDWQNKQEEKNIKPLIQVVSKKYDEHVVWIPVESENDYVLAIVLGSYLKDDVITAKDITTNSFATLRYIDPANPSKHTPKGLFYWKSSGDITENDIANRKKTYPMSNLPNGKSPFFIFDKYATKDYVHTQNGSTYNPEMALSKHPRGFVPKTSNNENKSESNAPLTQDKYKHEKYPLHKATLKGDFEYLAEKLISNTDSFYKKDADGHSIWYYAQTSGKKDIVELLRKIVYFKNKQGECPVCFENAEFNKCTVAHIECMHIICNDCKKSLSKQTVDKWGNVKCPICKQEPLKDK